jgi:hypothetical protein
VSPSNYTLDDRLDSLTVQPETRAAVEAQEHDLAAAEAPAGVDEPTRRSIERAIDDAFITGFRLVMLIAAGMAAASAIAAYALVQGKIVTAKPDAS